MKILLLLFSCYDIKQKNYQAILKGIYMVDAKIEKLDPMPTNLSLPAHEYGPICCKILCEFKNHFNCVDLPLPDSSLSLDKALSRIFDIMITALGPEKRLEIIKDVENYKMSMKVGLQ